MNDLTNLFGDFSLNSVENEFINYVYFDRFKNPNKLPINDVFLERVVHEIDKGAASDWKIQTSKKQKLKYVHTKKEVIPALHESWLPDVLPVFEFQEYDFSSPEEENTWFLDNNKNYIYFLEYLIKCTYHQFWCSIIFKENVQSSLRDFLLRPIPLYLYDELGEKSKKVYKSVFNAYYMVLRKLIFFKQSETEYMLKSLGCKYLIEKKLLNLSFAVTITLLYQDFDNELIDELSDVYFKHSGQEKFIQKEVEHLLKHTMVVFEMTKSKITGKLEPNIIEVPIALESRPKIFSLIWIDSVVNYILNILFTLSSLFRLHKSAIRIALSLHVPEKLSKNYEAVFKELYELLENREELKNENILPERIMRKIGLARSKFVEVFHSFVSFLLDITISNKGNPKGQQEYFELFIDTITVALESEIFICDYDYKYPISQTIEMFEDFSQMDKTRTDYIITSLVNLERYDFIKEKFSLEQAFYSHLPNTTTPVEDVQSSYSNELVRSDNEEVLLEDKIQSILGIFPHLGDGFVQKCLEHYDFNTDQVVQSILEENLPPHIIDIPHDFPRIPEEPKPPQPVLAYRGKKPGYDDALTLLNDKSEKDKMKTLILEGIKYNTRYDNSDDEFDERDELLEPDFVVEHEVEKYEKPNEEDLVSDTSYSENEFDDEGRPVEKTNPTGFRPFCENPEVVRARYEARFRSQRGRANVVGKPKGQGQEKNVLKARDKKNTQKSSRANHSRKAGSQFKRNKGMIPS